ncbi:NACHT domain-containing protein [Lactococcus lactis]|uniref:NACHT domain-containing protein n=1 Tax=Lactococcus lactis TaxID=1358 RepID=A0AAP3Z323_9LACT|nr:hypothetical protein [Lactococcus lactis]MDG4977473.1 hypothetical protein [Lactococcus lactis]
MDIVTSTVASLFAKNLGDATFSTVKTKIRDINNSKKFNNDLENYINISSERIKKVKTLFYDSVPKNIYDFYQPLKLTKDSFNFEKDNEIIDTSSVSYLLENYGNLLIVGHGGSGKTFLIKYLFLNSISEYYKIPVYLELRNYNEYNGTFIDYLHDSLKNSGFEMEKEFFLETLKSNQFIFFFDAFDEVYPEKQKKLSIEIKNFCNRYFRNKFILSCRFSEGFNDWSVVSEYRMVGLTKEDAISLVSKIDIEEKWKREFINDLKDGLYKKYKSFASSPLLLNIMLLTYGATSTLPDKLDKFYEKAFEALYYSHDLSKNRFRRKLESNLTYEQIKKIFSRICFKTYQRSQYTFTFDELISVIEYEKKKEDSKNIQEVDSQKLLNDLEINLCMFVKEGLNYNFVHRSFQEYFAAIFIDNRNEVDQKRIFPMLLEKKPIIGFIDTLENFWEIMFEINPDRFIDNVIVSQINNLFTENIGIIEYFSDMYSKISYSSDDANNPIGLSLEINPNSKFRSISNLFNNFIENSEKYNLSPNLFSEEVNKEVNDSIITYLKGLEYERFSSTHSQDISSFLMNDKIRSIIISKGKNWWATSNLPRILEWKVKYEFSRNDNKTTFLDDI